jgi:hypothetical protein
MQFGDITYFVIQRSEFTMKLGMLLVDRFNITPQMNVPPYVLF